MSGNVEREALSLLYFVLRAQPRASSPLHLSRLAAGLETAGSRSCKHDAILGGFPGAENERSLGPGLVLGGRPASRGAFGDSSSATEHGAEVAVGDTSSGCNQTKASWDTTIQPHLRQDH